MLKIIILYICFFGFSFAYYNQPFLVKNNLLNTHLNKHHHKNKSKYMIGYASYYQNHGYTKYMANGQKFHDDNIHLAAHPTLPLGTKLKVVTLSNYKSLYVEVTDRMPKHKGRVIDLSYAGGEYLGIINKGIDKVILKKVSNHEFKNALNDEFKDID